MATSPIINGPDDATETQRNLRNRAYAKLLAQQAMQPVPQQSAGGWVIRTPQTAYLAQALNRMVGLNALNGGDARRTGLAAMLRGTAPAPGSPDPGPQAMLAPPEPVGAQPMPPATADAPDPAAASGVADPVGGWPGPDAAQTALAPQPGVQVNSPDAPSNALAQGLQQSLEGDPVAGDMAPAAHGKLLGLRIREMLKS